MLFGESISSVTVVAHAYVLPYTDATASVTQQAASLPPRHRMHIATTRWPALTKNSSEGSATSSRPTLTRFTWPPEMPRTCKFATNRQETQSCQTVHQCKN
jgi:hypothetical protein